MQPLTTLKWCWHFHSLLGQANTQNNTSAGFKCRPDHCWQNNPLITRRTAVSIAQLMTAVVPTQPYQCHISMPVYDTCMAHWGSATVRSIINVRDAFRAVRPTGSHYIRPRLCAHSTHRGRGQEGCPHTVCTGRWWRTQGTGSTWARSWRWLLAASAPWWPPTSSHAESPGSSCAGQSRSPSSGSRSVVETMWRDKCDKSTISKREFLNTGTFGAKERNCITSGILYNVC